MPGQKAFELHPGNDAHDEGVGLIPVVIATHQEIKIREGGKIHIPVAISPQRVGDGELKTDKEVPVIYIVLHESKTHARPTVQTIEGIEQKKTLRRKKVARLHGVDLQIKDWRRKN